MADIPPVPVTTGFSWTAAGAWGSFFALLGLLVRQWVPFRKVKISEFEAVNTAQAEQIRHLTERVDALERKLDDQRQYYESRLMFERATYEGEIGLQRHATRNAKTILWGLLDLIEAAPEKAAAHAAKMRDRLAQLEEAERTEAATLRGAKIIASAKQETEVGEPA